MSEPSLSVVRYYKAKAGEATMDFTSQIPQSKPTFTFNRVPASLLLSLFLNSFKYSKFLLPKTFVRAMLPPSEPS